MKKLLYFITTLCIVIGLGACSLFLPAGDPPKNGITQGAKLPSEILSLDEALQQMQKKVAMFWAFKQKNQPPKVRLINDMINRGFEKIGYRLFNQMRRDEEILLTYEPDGYVMKQTFAFTVNAYQNDQSVLSWEVLIYPPQPKKNDELISKPTAYGIMPKPIWRSMPMHVKWEEIPFNEIKNVPKEKDSVMIIRPLR